MRKSCACMVEFQNICIALIKLNHFQNPVMFLTKDLWQICFGMIQMKMSMTGKKMKEDVVKYLVRRIYRTS